jgi:catechol 2,3-dioxygenase-like lactoylglutathione lyase family enzyme
MVVAKLLTMLLIAAYLCQPLGERQHIKGIAHLGYYVGDLSQARAYYVDFLGFEEAFCLKKPDGSEHIAFIKINDHQFIKLVAEAPKNHGFLYEVAFQADDVRGVRTFLAAAGVVVPQTVSRDQVGNLSFEISDPFGFTVRITQYEDGSLTARGKGKFMPKSRISTHIDHVGLLVGNRELAAKFYSDVLGFTGDGNSSKMRIGDGPDRFEIGLERKPPTIDRYRIKNHICLSVSDVPKVVANLKAKPTAKNYREIETHVLENGKHVAEMYDPDGNRVELMEPPKGN